MIYFTLNCFISFIITALLIKSRKLHRFFADYDLSGPQKMHLSPVPRVGGLGIYCALVLTLIYVVYIKNQNNQLLLQFIISSIPVFSLGLIEDLTKSVSPKKRLSAAFVSAAICIYLTKSYVSRIDIQVIDAYMLTWLPFSYLFTAFAVAGLINAINIIDGFNGLVSVTASIMFLSIAYVAWRVNDIDLLLVSLGCIGAILGFFIFNFPHGFIFLGDGGAYLIGFLLSQMSIYLVHKHSEVSPWYALLLFIYPIFETIFSVYRRKFLKGVPTTMPDGVHLHTLVYKRLMRWMVGSHIEKHIIRRNSFTSPYLWILSALGVFPATLFYNNTVILQVFCLIFIFVYLWLYIKIIKFQSPKWLIIRKK